MRPSVRFLSDDLIERIIAEARDLICALGVEIHNDNVTALLDDHGASVDRSTKRVYFTQDIIDKALKSAPHSFKLYDSLGNESTDFAEDKVHFTPGSTAIYFLDNESGRSRKAGTADYVRFAKLMGRMQHIASQSTAMVPSDVPELIQDSYRLYLSLRFCEKPVVTGTFTIEAFEVMKDMQIGRSRF